MKKILITLIVALLVGSGAYLLLQKNDTLQPNPNSNVAQTSNNTGQSSSGAYVDYSADVIAKTSGTKILFFHASWCPQCRALEKDIKDKSIPDGVTIIKVDYDTNQSLRQKYGVTIQTTLVKVDDNGNLVKKYVAYDEPNLEAVKKNLL